MVLYPQKFYMKCDKSKSFDKIFHLIKYYKNQDLQLSLHHPNNNMYSF